MNVNFSSTSFLVKTDLFPSSPTNTSGFILPGLNSKDITKLVLSYLNIHDLKRIASVSKAAKKMSEETTVDWINKNKSHIKSLGYHFTHLKTFLRRNGHLLKHLDSSDLKIQQSPQMDHHPLIDSIVYCPNLTYLSLKKCNLNRKDALLIASSHTLKKLEVLDLSENHIPTDGAAAIANTSILSHLILLNLSHNKICDKGAEAIATSPTLTNLMTLAIAGNDIHSEGAMAISTSHTLKKLTTLNLWGNLLSADGVKIVTTADMLENLTALNIAGNGVKEKKIKAIVASSTLKKCKIHY